MTDLSMPPAAHQGQEANPILVLQSRGGYLESFARGAVAIATADGEVLVAIGDVGRRVFPRSAIKLIQALALVESGAADAFDVSDIELALACASHSGEPRHVEAVSAWLTRIGAKPDDLVCGAHPPYDAASALAFAKVGQSPTRLHNNCSGKHTGFLTLAKHLRAPFAHYDHLDHPVQKKVAEVLTALSGEDAGAAPVGVDGCGAPNFALSLGALATAFARVANPSPLAPQRREAVLRLRAAAQANPFYTAGTGRLCTRIMTESSRIYVKGGAEGVYAAALPELGLGLALKIDDGGKVASEALLCGLLVGLGELESDSPIVDDTAFAAVRNAEGHVVGAREVVVDLLIEALGDFSPQALAVAASQRPLVEHPQSLPR